MGLLANEMIIRKDSNKKPRARVKQHQLYTARPKVWLSLKRNNQIPPEFKSKVREINVYNRASWIVGWLQQLFYTGRISRVNLKNQPPLFILGHWRSGTTHLHYMLAEDPRLGYLTNYQCYFFNLAFLTRSWLNPLISGLFPRTRPMDNMELSADKPGEEEQPLAAYSTRSGIHSFFFPRNRSYFEKYNFFRNVTEREKARWRRNFLFVTKSISLYNGNKPLLLKNPHNTSRVEQLLKIFPNAKFVLPHRDPYEVYRSMVHLYETIIRDQMLQDYSTEEVEDTVFYLFKNTMECYLAQRELIPAGNLKEIAYTDLAEHPLEIAAEIYRDLDIPGWENAGPAIEAYLHSIRDYKRNEFHPLPPHIVKRINYEWDFYFKAFGYPKRVIEPVQA